MYLTSPEHPTDISLQLGKACCPCSMWWGGGGGVNIFISSVFCFFHSHSCSSFFPVTISTPISSISFLPFSERQQKMTHKV